MIKLVVFYILFFVSIGFYSQCNTINNFNNGWYGQGGTWNISGAGNSVNQTVNGAAFFFLNGANLMNTSISGSFKTDDNDDDQMGFVFGVEGTIGVGNFHYYLLRWDEGGLGNGLYIDEIDQAGTVNLFSDVGNYWTRGFNHSFIIDYSLNSFSVTIDGVLLHTEIGSNNPGEFGFYNRSQANVTYSNLIYTGSFDYTVLTDTVCLGTNAEVELPLNLYDLPTITWDMGDGTIINNVRQVAHLYSTPGVYSVSCEGNDLSGCYGSISYDIVVLPNPKASFNYNDVCLGETMLFNNISTIASVDLFDDFRWDIDGNIASSRDTLFDFLTEGSYNVRLDVTTEFGCIDDTSVSVVVSPNPIINFTSANDCVADVALFSNSSSITSGTIVSNLWNFGDLPSPTTVQSTAVSPSYLYSNDGAYDVNLTVVSDMGCESNMTLNTFRFPMPNVSFSAINSCEYDSVNFVNTSTINAPGTFNGITWDYGDGSLQSTGFQQKHKYASPGVYQVGLSITSSDGCTSTQQESIEIYEAPVSSFQTTTVCDNAGPTTFQNLSSIGTGSIFISNWSFGDGSNGNVTNPSHKYNLGGVYQVELISVSNNGCQDTLESPVEVKKSPIASFYVNSTSGCSPLCLSFSDQSEVNASSLVSQQWIFDDTTLGFISSFEECFENLSKEEDLQIDFKYIVTNDIGCQDTLELEDYLSVYHNPVSSFTINPNVTNMYEREVEMLNESIGADNYLWFLEETIISEDFEPIYDYPDTGSFDVLLIAYTINNCIDSSFQTLLIEPVENVYVPSAFTPDGDGINDYFNVSTFGIREDGFLLRVFNRWGEEVFRSEDAFMGWDGTYKGSPSKSDVYVYRLIYNDLNFEIQEAKGTVTLMR